MTVHIPRLPFALDPLMAEAKRRARQRRLLIAVFLLALIGGAAGASLALRGPSQRVVGGRAKTASSSLGSGELAAYAYLIPSNPAAPRAGQWATRVSETKIRVGDRVPGPLGGLWKVVAVEPTAQDGQQAAVRGWPPLVAVVRHPKREWKNPIWAGKLVLRRAR